jgi:hypothetical protein
MKSQFPMTKIGHWDLVIDWSFGLGHWSFHIKHLFSLKFVAVQCRLQAIIA